MPKPKELDKKAMPALWREAGINSDLQHKTYELN